MKLYLAGINPAEHKEVFDLNPSPGFLTSFADANASKYLQGTNADAFLDCGAYTAFRCGKTIERDKYLEFALHNQERCKAIAYLDVIGEPRQSKENYDWFANKGLQGIPTFHIGSPWHYLEEICDRWQYVAIGGVAWRISTRKIQSTNTDLLKMLQKCHYIAGKKNVKLHGFGVTAWNLVERFPWHSVDSTTHLVGARFGHLLLPKKKPFKLRQFLCDNQKAFTKRSEIAKLLTMCPFEHSYKWGDLFIGTNAARNRVAFNAKAMCWAVERLSLNK